jgi:hypothetical protein
LLQLGQQRDRSHSRRVRFWPWSSVGRRQPGSAPCLPCWLSSGCPPWASTAGPGCGRWRRTSTA